MNFDFIKICRLKIFFFILINIFKFCYASAIRPRTSNPSYTPRWKDSCTMLLFACICICMCCNLGATGRSDRCNQKVTFSSNRDNQSACKGLSLRPSNPLRHCSGGNLMHLTIFIYNIWWYTSVNWCIKWDEWSMQDCAPSMACFNINRSLSPLIFQRILEFFYLESSWLTLPTAK